MSEPDPASLADAFRAAWWLPGPNLQTMWGRLVRSRRLLPMRREILATPDGDDLVLDHAGDELAPAAPRLILLHGLEGSSCSVYVQGLAAAALARGWRVTAMNFRSCARDPRRLSRQLLNRRPRLYHSGETEDFGFVLRTLAAREPEAPLAACGVSIGGNVLVKWLGENGAASPLRAAAALSVPFDLAAGARHLEHGTGRFYTRMFLRTLRAKSLSVAGRFPGAPVDVAAATRARTFWEFDDAATAPLHGFAGADDYYTRSSSLNWIERVRTPLLCLSAADDPFLPEEALDRVRQRAPSGVTLVVTRRGGHAGWVGASPSSRYWGEATALGFLERHLGAARGATS